MRKLLFVIVPLSAVLWGCSGSGGGDGGISGIVDAGPDGGSTGGGFQLTDLDLGDAGPGPNDVVAAALSSDGRIGIAYYWDLDAAHRRLEYIEVQTDGSTHAVTLAPSVQRTSGLSVAFDSSGNGHVAYLGNDPNFQEPIETMAPDGGVFWTESDLALATISPAGVLSTDYVEHNGMERDPGFTQFCQVAGGPSPVSDRDSPVVGISPAITPFGDQLAIIFRNLHAGQFPVQDYAESDTESVVGMPGNWTHNVATCGSDTGAEFVHKGLGAESSVTTFNGNVLALTAGSVDANGSVTGLYEITLDNNVWGQEQSLFPQQSNDDGAGPRIVGTADAGVGIAWVDQIHSILYYANSPDGENWSGFENAFGAGTGGWYPSLAFDPTIGLPAIAFFICSQEPGIGAGNCPADELSLQVTRRNPQNGGTWVPTEVDPTGGFFPTLLFNGGQMIVVYRSLETNGIRVARQVAP